MNWPEDFVNKIICRDNLSVMKEMPDECIDMAITSPPYWGLRDYGFEQIFGGDRNCEHEWGKEFLPGNYNWMNYQNILGNLDKGHSQYKDKQRSSFCIKCGAWKGQLGLEPTPEMYIEHLTEIFNEVKRILKKEGTFWLNMGDTYGGSQQGGGDTGLSKERHRKELLTYKNKPQRKLMPKCLLMIPERLAWSLIQNGWILRNKIPWIKPNCMPSSVKDRYTNKYEFVYYFVKSQRNYFDLDSIREPHLYNGRKDTIYKETNRDRKIGSIGSHERWPDPKGKNPGDIWIISTRPCPIKGVHFATFPEKLCKKAIIPGSPENGIVLDPFCGIGTALYVAKQLRRRFIGIDIKKEYCELAEKRLAQGVL